MSASSTPRRKPGFPTSLTDLTRYRKTVHGHNGSSRIVMVRKTDQRTFSSIEKGQDPKLETITRETVETFRGERTECKITTEKKNVENVCSPSSIDSKVTKVQPLSQRHKISNMDFQQECLRAHNDIRKLHGVPPLKLDREITKIAQDWANNLAIRRTLQHSNNRNFGENLFSVSSTNPNFTINGREVVNEWYNEIERHIFHEEPTSLSTGHFTQVVWKESVKLGVGIAKSGGRVVVVANYDPPGNYIGQFTENVPPLLNQNNNSLETSEIGERLRNLQVTPSKMVKNGTEGDFSIDFLKAHNNYRQQHGVPLLKLDKKMCKYSEEWAKYLASKNTLEHRPECNFGENIYCMSSSDTNFTITGFTPVDTWYEEIQHHQFNKEPDSLKTGHFTQVIWKSSELLGVGVAKNTHGSIYVVANYSPAGNFIGNYMENVPPLQKISIHENTNREDNFSLNNDFDRFALEGLRVHNEYRRRHGVCELKLNKKMCNFAQNWADTCAKSGSMCHRLNSPYGENIFCVYSSDFSHVPSARDAIKEWYDEVKKYSFDEESINHGCLHFTQIVWKDCNELGFAMARNQKGETYVVANYSPKGNYIGQFCENVNRPRI